MCAPLTQTERRFLAPATIDETLSLSPRSHTHTHTRKSAALIPPPCLCVSVCVCAILPDAITIEPGGDVAVS